MAFESFDYEKMYKNNKFFNDSKEARNYAFLYSNNIGIQPYKLKILNISEPIASGKTFNLSCILLDHNGV